ncbi:MAG: 50S ribosomal protein L4 [Patescibacteria group bacterium]
MPSVKVYTQEGKVAGEIELNAKHFGVKPDPALVHSVTVAQQANARRPIAHTKNRGEVAGGGKKPWKQKGTGRARQGSIRSPQWKGGGVVFGPRNVRNFSLKVNRKVKQKALFMALSDKVTDDRFLVLESFKPAEPKTKLAAQLVKNLPITRKVLFVIPKSDASLLRMVRNLQNVTVVTVNSLNLVDVLSNQTLLFMKDTVPAFETLYRNA